MTDLEFDVLDELYFVTPFAQVLRMLEITDEELKNTLRNLIRKGWVKCFKTVSEQVEEEDLDFENEFQEYYYLATKEGLLAHNIG